MLDHAGNRGFEQRRDGLRGRTVREVFDYLPGGRQMTDRIVGDRLNGSPQHGIFHILQISLKRVVKAVPLHHRLLDIERMQENCC